MFKGSYFKLFLDLINRFNSVMFVEANPPPDIEYGEDILENYIKERIKLGLKDDFNNILNVIREIIIKCLNLFKGASEECGEDQSSNIKTTIEKITEKIEKIKNEKLQ